MTAPRNLAYLLGHTGQHLPAQTQGESTVHKLILSCVLGIVVAASTSAAFAATDLEVFTKFARKFAADDVGARKKSLCACQDGSSVNGVAGYVIAKPNSSGITRVELRCVVPTFANDGTFLSNSFCATFTAVGK